MLLGLALLLTGVWGTLALVYAGPQQHTLRIAHIFPSFAFSDGEHEAISIETRKEKGEACSTLAGFRRYVLCYVDANERDVIQLRTNCTTNIGFNSLVDPNHLAFNWKILASGYRPDLLYEKERLAESDRLFAELRERAYVNPRAQAADQSSDFPRLIRSEPLPKYPSATLQNHDQ